MSANTIARWERGELPIGSPLLLRLALEQLAAASSSERSARQATSWPGHRATEASELWPAVGEVPQVAGTLFGRGAELAFIETALSTGADRL